MRTMVDLEDMENGFECGSCRIESIAFKNQGTGRWEHKTHWVVSEDSRKMNYDSLEAAKIEAEAEIDYARRLKESNKWPQIRSICRRKWIHSKSEYVWEYCNHTIWLDGVWVASANTLEKAGKRLDKLLKEKENEKKNT